MSTVQKLVVPTEPDRGRPVIKVSLKRPDGVWSPYYMFNWDTGATRPTYVPLEEVATVTKSGMPYKSNPWGSVTSSQKDFADVEIRIEKFAGTYKVPVARLDDDHYDTLRDDYDFSPPYTRYPLLRVRDIAKYMSMIFAKENTTLTLGTTQPQELKDAVTAGKIIPRLADMKKRTDTVNGKPTPTSGWQWYIGYLVNPKTGAKYKDWFGCNTGDRRAIVKRSIVDKVGITYPKLTSSNDYRADTSPATIDWTESNPKIDMTNIKIQVRDDDQEFASGGTPRNLVGGPPFLDRYSIVLWSQYLHLAFIPR